MMSTPRTYGFGFGFNSGYLTIGRRYRFDPYLETTCTPIHEPWSNKQKRFYIGRCIRFENKLGAYVFQGRPEGSAVEHYFIVKCGHGARVSVLKSSHLRLVKQ